MPCKLLPNSALSFVKKSEAAAAKFSCLAAPTANERSCTRDTVPVPPPAIICEIFSVASPNCAASSSEITVRDAPVSSAKSYGPFSFTKTGTRTSGSSAFGQWKTNRRGARSRAGVGKGDVAGLVVDLEGIVRNVMASYGGWPGVSFLVRVHTTGVRRPCVCLQGRVEDFDRN